MRIDALQGDCIRMVVFCRLLVLALCLAAGPSALSQDVEIQHEGRTYVDLASAGGRLGMQAYWLKGYDTLRLRSQWTTVDAGKGGVFFI